MPLLLLLVLAFPARPDTVDAGVLSVLVPRDTVDSGAAVTPAALVGNFGYLDTGFPVTMRIGAHYDTTTNVRVAAGSSDTIFFPDWTPHETGQLSVTCFTGLAGDTDPTNDTAHGLVTVVVPFSDVGIAEISAPGELLYVGDTVVPHALIRNFGSATERYFDVRFRIGNDYNHIVTVEELAPGIALDTSFPPWRALAGSYDVSCSTMLSRDMYPVNDRLQQSVTVRRPRALTVEPDTAVSVDPGATVTIGMSAAMTGDEGDSVGLVPADVAGDWRVEYLDDSSGGALPVEDGLALLGYIAPYARRQFDVRVTAPAEVTGSGTPGITFPVVGTALADTSVRDTADVVVTLEPAFDVHNYPNPLRDSTTFVLSLPEDGTTTLRVYDRPGRLIAEVLGPEAMRRGIHHRGWRALDRSGAVVAPGTYQYVLVYETEERTHRVTKRLVVARD